MAESDEQDRSEILAELRGIRDRITELEQGERALEEARASLRDSESRYRNLYDNAPDMLLSVDLASLRIDECNETLACALGLPKPEVIGMRARDLYAEECYPALLEVLAKVELTGEAQAEVRLVRPGGGRIDVSLRTTAIRDAQGRPVRSNTVLRDISERKRDEAARLVTESRMRALVESSHDLISELDAAGRILWVTPNVPGTLGWSVAEMVGMDALARVHPDDVAATRASIGRVLRTGKETRHEYRYLHKHDGWLWLEASSTAYEAGSGVTRMLVVTRDVTGRRRDLQERERVVREKERAMAHVRVLSGLLPICTHCRKVRDDEGYWRNLETYVSSHSTAVFSHSLCEGCLETHYSDIVGEE